MPSKATNVNAGPAASAPPAAVVAPVAAPTFLSTKEAAALLGVSVKGLESLRARGAGPAYVRVGKLIRYRASDLVGSGS